MTPPDLRTTRTYYLTWQACGLGLALCAGYTTYLVCLLMGPVGFPEGILVGAVMANIWHRTKWKEGDR